MSFRDRHRASLSGGRVQNDQIRFKAEMLGNKVYAVKHGGDEFRPKHLNLETGENVSRFKDAVEINRLSGTKYIREKLGKEERGFSNGETGVMYISEMFSEEGLYILDEPENSLSAELQMKLADLIQYMVQYNNCQVIVSTHSPFLLSMRDANTVLSLSEEANKVAMGFEEWLESAKSDSQTSDYEKGVLSKLDIIMLRLACVARMLAIADGDNSHEVTATEMEWACDLCRYLHQTQMRVYEELQSGNRQRPMNDRELIRAFFKRFESKGVTQGKLAKLLNTSQPYISQCVNPKAKPTQETESAEQ